MKLNTRVVGASCDCCGATPSSEVKLSKCNKCLRKAYCSKGCQLADWREGGHKKSCRPPKDFKAQDIIRVVGVQSKPELNGRLMVVVGPDPKAEGRWEVTVVGAGPENSSISLHVGKMHLIVAFEEREDI